MSQLYRIQLKTSVSETFDLSDRIVHRLELTNILAEEEMVDILKSMLEANGYEQQEDGTYAKKGEDGEDIVFDLEEMKVSASLEEEKELATEAVAHGQAWDSRVAARENAKSQLETAKDSAKSQLETQSKQLQKDLSKKLEEGESRRNRELHEMLQQVYAESLKRKARQLGDVLGERESIQDGQYELVIHIEQ